MFCAVLCPFHHSSCQSHHSNCVEVSKISPTTQTRKPHVDMGTTQFVSIRFNSVSESFDSESTHDSQWLSKIDSNQLTTQSNLLEFDSNRLVTTHDSKSFPQFRFKLTHDSKRFSNYGSNRLMTKKIWNIDSNQLMTQLQGRSGHTRSKNS